MAKILILDDLPDAGNLIRRLLKGREHQVFTFTKAEAALRFAIGHPVDLAILDIKLKRRTGLEVLKELRKTCPSLKAIILTGYPTPETAQEALQLGASAYLTKPIDLDVLEAKVMKVLSLG